MKMQRRNSRVILLALSVIGCDSADEACVTPPCLMPIAMNVTVTSSVSGGSVPGAFVSIPNYSPNIPCTQSPGTTCIIPGGAGTYELDVGAPGFQSVHRTIVVTGTSPRCGCPTVESQQVSVALVPVPLAPRS
jgi:hypothetical protein